MTQNHKRVSNRLIKNLLGAWKGLASPFSGNRLELSAYLHEDELESLRNKFRECLDSKRGQVSARARAAELGKAYLGLNDEGKSKYLSLLATEFGNDHDLVRVTAEKLFTDLTDADRNETEQLLRNQLTPPYLTLLTQFNALPNGLKFLVDMRGDLIRFAPDKPALKSMESELKTQLGSWFDIGFLELRRIDWNAPASLLERLIAYEAAHEVESWDDLHHRLAENRRCFAFFHPRMPDEPLIFVWVALENNLSENVDILLDINQSEVISQDDNTAIFYSINSTQSGLNGVILGDFLIKRVTEVLQQELPQLTQFSTLSPIPGFTEWLSLQIKQSPDALFTESQRNELSNHTDQSLEALLVEGEWFQDQRVIDAMRQVLLPLAARYLTEEKRNGHTAFDAEAHFHLSNGAKVERINWLGDTSARGKSQSYTMMVNYLYDPDSIEQNHEQYIAQGTIATSKEVAQLIDRSSKE